MAHIKEKTFETKRLTRQGGVKTALTHPPYRRGGRLLTSFLSCLGITLIPLVLDANGLSKTLDLSHWGLSSPSQVGFMSIGVLHKQEGDELVVHNVRQNKPTLQEPRTPKSQVPSFEGDVLLVDDFSHGNRNRIGGYFGGFSLPPSEGHVSIAYCPDEMTSLCFSYHQKAAGFAGFWIHLFNFKLPPIERVFLDTTPFAYLTFSIRGEKGGEKLWLQVSDHGWERKGDSVRVGDIDSFLPPGGIEKWWKRAWVPLSTMPTEINRKALAAWIFIGRNGPGRVFISDVAFTTRRDSEIQRREPQRPPRRPLRKGMWVWETEKLLQDEAEQDSLAGFSKGSKLTDVFLQLPYKARKKNEEWESIWDHHMMKSLITKLHRKDIRVHALDGNPRFALRHWHGQVLATIRSVIQYQRSASQEERFDGIRYDIEPYLLPEFPGVGKSRVLEDYLTLLRNSKKLCASAKLEFGVDIPFWLDGCNEFFEPMASLHGRPMSEWILNTVDNAGIMSYRTVAYGPDGVIAHAFDEIEYASRMGKDVFIGLEIGQLPNETMFEFGRGEGKSGAFLEPSGGTKIFLRLTTGEGDQLHHNGLFLAEKNRVHVPSGKITFAEKSAGDLYDVMTKSEREFSHHPGFCGFAIHSYESYRPWLQRQGRQ